MTRAIAPRWCIKYFLETLRFLYTERWYLWCACVRNKSSRLYTQYVHCALTRQVMRIRIIICFPKLLRIQLYRYHRNNCWKYFLPLCVYIWSLTFYYNYTISRCGSTPPTFKESMKMRIVAQIGESLKFDDIKYYGWHFNSKSLRLIKFFLTIR